MHLLGALVRSCARIMNSTQQKMFPGHVDRFLWCFTRAVIGQIRHNWFIVHFNICMFLHWLLLVDQCDGSNLASAEASFRRLQTIEFSYQERAREKASLGGNRLTLDEQYAFGGHHQERYRPHGVP